MKNEKGQVVLILVLVMTVGLAIGLSVIQRSLSDVSSSSKVEQSSRAFSAAEAGIEKALNGDSTPITAGTFDNQATATVTGTGLIPLSPSPGNRQEPLEYPPLAKEETATVWLADPNSLTNPPAEYYKHNSLDVYWGNSPTDKAALELTLVYFDGSAYTSRNTKWYLDQIDRSNGFEVVSCTGNYTLAGYQCKKTITGLPDGLMLLRARLLYNTISQPFAVQAVGSCGANCSLPPQQKKIISTGTAGTTQRKVQLFQENKVVPPFFDYAIFSSGDINK